MILSRVGKMYPGWWVAFGACLSLGLVAGMGFWAFGLSVDPLQAEFGWSPAILGGAVSLSLLLSGLASPMVGRLVDRFQPRTVILVGSVATVIGYLLLARIEELWQFLALTAFLGFFRAWIFYVPFTTLVTHWFSRRRATAMGIATSGFGIGGLAFLPLMSELLTVIGWRGAFVVAALLVVVINGAFVMLVRNRPSEQEARYELEMAARSRVPVDGLFSFDRLGTIYRTPVFWLASAGFSLLFFAQWAFLFHAPQLLGTGGIDGRDAAFALGASAGIGVALRLVSGAALDRIIRLELLAAAVLVVMALALTVLATGTSLPAMGAFVVLWGLGSGIGPALEPMLVGRLFGRKYYASVYGVMDGVDTVVSIPGPWLGGLLLDVTGSYLPVLGLYALAFVLGGAGFALLPRIGGRYRLAAQAESAELTSTPAPALAA